SRHTVYLVEKSPSIGGHMAQLDKTFPTLDCSACSLTPRMNQVGSHPYIKLMTYSEVAGVSGFVGNFKVKIKKKARFVDETKCTGCGTCIEKCPFKAPSEFDMGLSKRKAIYTPFPQAVPNKPVIDKEHCAYFKTGKCQACLKFCKQGAIDFDMKDEEVEVEVGNIIVATGYETYDPTPIYQYGYGRLDNVVTALQFERMINASGPTSGKILLKSGKEPKSVAIVHCVGSRDKNIHEYCSQVCCMYSIKFSHLVRDHVPGAKVYELYIDNRAVGKAYEEFYNRALDEGTNFIRGKPSDIVKHNGNLLIQVEDTLADCQREIPVDMVVLSAALEPKADAEDIARLFSLSRSTDGFFMEKHPKLDPVATMNDGVFVVGCCQGPKDIPHSVVQASAAAARVLAMISVGTIEIEPITAVVNEEKCSGCRICAHLCPYNAVSFDAEKKVSLVNEALCKGCGTCVAACPSGAITGSHFTTEQIMAEIEGVLV
ncbi:MAG: CoB--CoM heterodisulfide reductase iron-sulfur subunit A family protein, partial [Chloroflexota bacterium]|nr:CoB--CoM heterodisulfide reductase iron-sulfur subunit A family protein [Chloroflexota bacterium]